MYIGQLQWSYAMEETSETTVPEIESNSNEVRDLSDSMDGPSVSQNQDTSSAMENIIDNDNGDNVINEDSPSDPEGGDE
tara:strand:+ start:715 stop:951 length:237 start_codon:yes stop_codon:yes gene_type:complete